jgi:hypothetical protein
VPDTELSGCPQAPSGSCTKKLSNEIRSVLADPDVAQLAQLPDGRRCPEYSKSVDGALLLGRLDPDIVAKRCPKYFGPGLDELRAAIRRLRT